MRPIYRRAIPTQRDLVVRAVVLAGALALSVCLGSAASAGTATAAASSPATADETSMALSAGSLVPFETPN